MPETLWFFAYSRIQLAYVCPGSGLAFGTFDQTHQAAAFLFVTPLLVVRAVFLTVRAFALP